MRALLLVLALSLFCAPAKAEVIAVCGTAGAPEAASYGNVLALNVIEPKRDQKAGKSQLALWHDEKGFDVLLNWGQQNQLSLRAEGAEIIGDELDSDLIHLVVVRVGTNGLEHFVFSWDAHAVGELLWGVPDAEAQDGNDVVTDRMACIRPKH